MKYLLPHKAALDRLIDAGYTYIATKPHHAHGFCRWFSQQHDGSLEDECYYTVQAVWDKSPQMREAWGSPADTVYADKTPGYTARRQYFVRMLVRSARDMVKARHGD